MLRQIFGNCVIISVISESNWVFSCVGGKLFGQYDINSGSGQCKHTRNSTRNELHMPEMPHDSQTIPLKVNLAMKIEHAGSEKKK